MRPLGRHDEASRLLSDIYGWFTDGFDPVEDCSGPIWLRGGISLMSADGYRYEVRNRMTICRCGASKNKPFCDGSHASIKFNTKRSAE